MPTAPPTMAPLRNRTFRMLWIAALSSNFGGLVQAVGAAWMMTTLTDSESMVALVQTSVALPIMIFSMAAGVFADNFDRRRVMIAAQCFMLCMSVILAFMAYQNLLTPWLLLGFTFMIGCGTALHNPSWQASMGDIVPREDLPAAVSLNSMGFNLMRSVGPAAGGAIVALAGAAAAFAVNAVSYLAIIAALRAWHPKLTSSKLPREHFGSAFPAGLRYVAMSPNLLKVIARVFVFGVAAVAIQALLPVVVRDHLESGAFVYGVMLGCFGFGAVVGAMTNGQLRARFHNERIVRMGFVGNAACTAILAVTHSSLVAGAALMLAGLCWVISMSLFNVTVQLSTPRWVVGRVLALHQTAAFGGMAGGSWLWGSVSDGFSTEIALLLAALFLVFGALIGLRAPLPNFGNLNLDPLNTFVEPPLELDLTQRSGPIMVLVEYRIRETDVEEFLAAMSLRRRMRIRDGAQQWALLRDLERPDFWSETYHVPTWNDYIRHNERRTQDDAALSKQISALHCGEQPLRVRRMIERQTIPRHDNIPRRRTTSE